LFIPEIGFEKCIKYLPINVFEKGIILGNNADDDDNNMITGSYSKT